VSRGNRLPGVNDLEPTWASRDLPILRAALRRLDAGEDFPELEDIRREAGVTVVELHAGIRALESADPPYIDVTFLGGGSEERASGHVDAVSERARRELGVWPSPESLVDALAAAFARAADAEREPEKRTKLRAVADGLVGAARDIAVGVVTKKIGDI
jgi:hypothetical protein